MTLALEVNSLSKTFTRTRALSKVSMTIEPGEVRVLLGQNGSGKSTLIKILSGYHTPDPGGHVNIAGNELPFHSPIHSYRLGLRVVQQDLGLIPTLSVLDNMSITSGFPTRLATIRPKASREQAATDLARLNLEIDPKTPVSALSASQRTGVAVARALREDPAYPPNLLVLDEPTAALPIDEVGTLLDMVKDMAATGVGVLYVTHHLGEVARVGTKLSIFRDGEVVGDGAVSEFDHPTIVALLTGDATRSEDATTHARRLARARRHDGEAVLQVDDLHAPTINGITMRVHAGEIVGVAGLSGSGRDVLLGALFGAVARSHGEVRVNGTPLPSHRPDTAIRRGVAYVAADRKQSGVMTLAARENFTLPQLRPFWHGGLLRRRAERRSAREWFDRLSVRPARATEETLGVFSGGNQQKILFGKWLSQVPPVFLLDEPTQGVDVGAKADLHHEILTAAENDAAVILASSDLEELAALSDRVLVLIEGKIAAELHGENVTEATITASFMPAATVPAEAA